MPLETKEIGLDHDGNELPDGICARARKDNGVIVSFKVRWRQEDPDGIRRQPSKSFSARKLGSLDAALDAAVGYLAEAQEVVRAGSAVPKKDASLTPNDVLKEWITNQGPRVSEGYAKKVVRLWSNEVEHRPIARTRLERISNDQSTIVRFQDEVVGERMSEPKEWEVLKTFRTIMRWGRRRHPNQLTVELSGLIELPTVNRSRLPYAADAVGVARVIEAVLKRPARDDLLPLRDAAFIAAMGFTVATRPSEWRRSVLLENLFAPPENLFAPPSTGGMGTVEIQRAGRGERKSNSGLKTGAHVALVLPTGWEYIATYLEARESRFGKEPGNALLFQVLDDDGPVWITPEGGGEREPLAWTMNTLSRTRFDGDLFSWIQLSS